MRDIISGRIVTKKVSYFAKKYIGLPWMHERHKTEEDDKIKFIFVFAQLTHVKITNSKGHMVANQRDVGCDATLCGNL